MAACRPQRAHECHGAVPVGEAPALHPGITPLIEKNALRWFLCLVRELTCAKYREYGIIPLCVFLGPNASVESKWRLGLLVALRAAKTYSQVAQRLVSFICAGSEGFGGPNARMCSIPS